MKKYFLIAVALVLGAVCMTSCGDDEDEKVEKAAGDLVSGKTKPTITITESDNQIVMTTVYPGICTETSTATFNAEGKCIQYITTETYASDALADAQWATINNVYDEDKMKAFTRNGKTIIEDETDYYLGDTKESIKSWFESVKKAIEEEYNK